MDTVVGVAVIDIDATVAIIDVDAMVIALVDIEAIVGVITVRQTATCINVFYGMRQGEEGTKVSD